MELHYRAVCWFESLIFSAFLARFPLRCSCERGVTLAELGRATGLDAAVLHEELAGLLAAGLLLERAHGESSAPATRSFVLPRYASSALALPSSVQAVAYLLSHCLSGGALPCLVAAELLGWDSRELGRVLLLTTNDAGVGGGEPCGPLEAVLASPLNRRTEACDWQFYGPDGLLQFRFRRRRELLRGGSHHRLDKPAAAAATAATASPPDAGVPAVGTLDSSDSLDHERLQQQQQQQQLDPWGAAAAQWAAATATSSAGVSTSISNTIDTDDDEDVIGAAALPSALDSAGINGSALMSSSRTPSGLSSRVLEELPGLYASSDLQRMIDVFSGAAAHSAGDAATDTGGSGMGYFPSSSFQMTSPSDTFIAASASATAATASPATTISPPSALSASALLLFEKQLSDALPPSTRGWSLCAPTLRSLVRASPPDSVGALFARVTGGATPASGAWCGWLEHASMTAAAASSPSAPTASSVDQPSLFAPLPPLPRLLRVFYTAALDAFRSYGEANLLPSRVRDNAGEVDDVMHASSGDLIAPPADSQLSSAALAAALAAGRRALLPAELRVLLSQPQQCGQEGNGSVLPLCGDDGSTISSGAGAIATAASAPASSTSPARNAEWKSAPPSPTTAAAASSSSAPITEASTSTAWLAAQQRILHVVPRSAADSSGARTDALRAAASRAVRELKAEMSRMSTVASAAATAAAAAAASARMKAERGEGLGPYATLEESFSAIAAGDEGAVGKKRRRKQTQTQQQLLLQQQLAEALKRDHPGDGIDDVTASPQVNEGDTRRRRRLSQDQPHSTPLRGTGLDDDSVIVGARDANDADEEDGSDGDFDVASLPPSSSSSSSDGLCDDDRSSGEEEGAESDARSSDLGDNASAHAPVSRRRGGGRGRRVGFSLGGSRAPRARGRGRGRGSGRGRAHAAGTASTSPSAPFDGEEADGRMGGRGKAARRASLAADDGGDGDDDDISDGDAAVGGAAGAVKSSASTVAGHLPRLGYVGPPCPVRATAPSSTTAAAASTSTSTATEVPEGVGSGDDTLAVTAAPLSAAVEAASGATTYSPAVASAPAAAAAASAPTDPSTVSANRSDVDVACVMKLLLVGAATAAAAVSERSAQRLVRHLISPPVSSASAATVAVTTAVVQECIDACDGDVDFVRALIEGLQEAGWLVPPFSDDETSTSSASAPTARSIAAELVASQAYASAFSPASAAMLAVGFLPGEMRRLASSASANVPRGGVSATLTADVASTSAAVSANGADASCAPVAAAASSHTEISARASSSGGVNAERCVAVPVDMMDEDAPAANGHAHCNGNGIHSDVNGVPSGGSSVQDPSDTAWPPPPPLPSLPPRRAWVP